MMVPAHERDTWAHSDNERSRDIKWCGEGQAKTETNRLDRRLWRHLVTLSGNLAQKLFTPFAWGESFFANLPLTIGAIALSTATLGVDWFKFAEENMDSCQPVHFHSAQCSFPEVRNVH